MGLSFIACRMCSLMQAALTRTLNTLGRKTKALKENEANLAGDHIREGLSCVISVKVQHHHCFTLASYALHEQCMLFLPHGCSGIASRHDMHVMPMQVPEPEFEGQTKTRLGNPEVRKIVDACVAKVGNLSCALLLLHVCILSAHHLAESAHARCLRCAHHVSLMPLQHLGCLGSCQNAPGMPSMLYGCRGSWRA